ncbi:Major facilitator superfamily [Dillenia turbinata]|uniref:Major facilitator superfamily n=1 Tax=Dillenia turbinata TaxID=194707 RepID=A0AAN8URN8_9MAGN
MGKEQSNAIKELTNPSVVISLETDTDMASSSNKDSAANPSWFTPKRLLILFCVINMINYMDRGAIASNGVNGSENTCTNGTCTGGSGIQGDFNLSNFEDGVLSSAFMVGLLVASPIFASLAKSFNPFRLIGVGLSVWTFAVAACGFSFDFWSITICRMLVGVGEASFISLAAPFIDDNAPVTQKTVWLGTFYMCIPSGYALGYVYGGLVGDHFSWRYAFWGEAILMLPFVVLGFIMKPLQLKGFAPANSTKALTSGETVAPDVQDSNTSSGNGSFIPKKEEFKDQPIDKPSKLNIARNQISRFLKDLKILLLEKSDADMIFGGITIVCGILGSLGGGFILDHLLSSTTFLGAIFCFTAFCFKSMYAFLALFAVGELLIFATQAPVNFVCLHCVNPSLRPLSMAMSTVSIHLFGDVPSSPLVGVLEDHINDWRKTALILTSVLFIAAAIWFIGVFMHSVDRYNEESQHKATTTDRLNTTPLLDENMVKITETSCEP